jgi:hypothetical protein
MPTMSRSQNSGPVTNHHPAPKANRDVESVVRIIVLAFLPFWCVASPGKSTMTPGGPDVYRESP